MGATISFNDESIMVLKSITSDILRYGPLRSESDRKLIWGIVLGYGTMLNVKEEHPFSGLLVVFQ